MIYALLHPLEPYVYVGKTSGRRLSAAYSEHVCQRIAATSGYFDKQDERPRLHLLNTLECTRSLAYKHVVAWTHVFTVAGYACLNHDGTLYHAESLRADTQEIVNQIQQAPLEAILARTFLKKPADGNRPPEKKEDAGPLIQMNLRISTRDKTQFAAYCTKHGMTQREGFSLLLDNLQQESDSHHMQLLADLQKKCTALTEDNRNLKKKLAVMSGVELPEAVQRSLYLLAMQKDCIALYLEQTLPVEITGEPLKHGSYRKYMKQLRVEEAYAYPSKEGPMILHPEAILWGNPLHRACFIVGTGEDGLRYKLRYYPKTSYTGIRMDNEQYVRQGARLLVCAQQSRDGTMELVLAMPLPEIIPKAAEIPETPEIMERKSSLDDRIRAIEDRM